MFRRLTWLGIGLVTGLGASRWVERKVRKQLAHYLPVGQLPIKAGAQLADRAREKASSRILDLRSAVDGGRDAMAARESELRRQLGLEEPGPGQSGGGHDLQGGRGERERRSRKFDR